MAFRRGPTGSRPRPAICISRGCHSPASNDSSGWPGETLEVEAVDVVLSEHERFPEQRLIALHDDAAEASRVQAVTAGGERAVRERMRDSP